METVEIRPVRPEDNVAIAAIIRAALTEFGANKPGTVFTDPTTDDLYSLFRTPKSIYYVALMEGRILGGAGIYPSEGLPTATCELVKMYLRPDARGLGLGKNLIEKCLDFAKQQQFQQVYIESMPELKKALKVYEKAGFRYLNAPLGNTGHFGCELWMLKVL